MQEGYAWEEAYKRSWDVLADDTPLESLVMSLRRPQKKLRVSVQRGIIRYLIVVLDLSAHSTMTDWRPTAAETSLRITKKFVQQFFDQNPLSLISLVVLKDGIAKQISPFSSNPTLHLSALKLKDNRTPSGEPSIQNALLYGINSLSLTPSHGTKQMIIIYSSLTSCDPGDIFDSLRELKQKQVQVNVIGLNAQLEILKRLAKDTTGTYTVAINETHLDDILNEMIQPPPITAEMSNTNFVLMGFPKLLEFSLPLLCVCHNASVDKGYECPRCNAIVCSLPSDCEICGLSLVSSSLLARSYHHLFPVSEFKEIEWTSLTPNDSSECYACHTSFPLPEQQGTLNCDRFQCKKCKYLFCSDCDLFIHEVVHNCPGCSC